MHYVCNSCQGVSPIPKHCETVDCSLNGQDLTACDCQNPEHLDKVKDNEENKEGESQASDESVHNPVS